ncbi:hypothetical protein THZB04_60148 [Vibrio owensii]|nr:hypothetical protein THZB04_60148 [Vibrio owensii]
MKYVGISRHFSPINLGYFRLMIWLTSKVIMTLSLLLYRKYKSKRTETMAED